MIVLTHIPDNKVPGWNAGNCARMGHFVMLNPVPFILSSICIVRMIVDDLLNTMSNPAYGASIRLNAISFQLNRASSGLNTASSPLNATQLHLNQISHGQNGSSDTLNTNRHRLNDSFDGLNATQLHLNQSSYRLNTTSGQLNRSSGRLNTTHDRLNTTSGRLNRFLHLLATSPVRHIDVFNNLTSIPVVLSTAWNGRLTASHGLFNLPATLWCSSPPLVPKYFPHNLRHTSRKMFVFVQTVPGRARHFNFIFNCL